RMIEVKSSTEVKDYQRDDVAIQAFAAKKSGAPISETAIAHIDKTWVYPGEEDYEGFLVESDVTEDALCRESEVGSWVATARDIAQARTEPEIRTGGHCSKPFECGFTAYCRSKEPNAEYP